VLAYDVKSLITKLRGGVDGSVGCLLVVSVLNFVWASEVDADSNEDYQLSFLLVVVLREYSYDCNEYCYNGSPWH